MSRPAKLRVVKQREAWKTLVVPAATHAEVKRLAKLSGVKIFVLIQTLLATYDSKTILRVRIAELQAQLDTEP